MLPDAEVGYTTWHIKLSSMQAGFSYRKNQSCREIFQGFTGKTGLTVSGNDFGTRCQNESFRRVPSLKLT